MPITITHIGQTGHLGGKIVLFLDGMDEEIKNDRIEQQSKSRWFNTTGRAELPAVFSIAAIQFLLASLLEELHGSGP